MSRKAHPIGFRLNNDYFWECALDPQVYFRAVRWILFLTQWFRDFCIQQKFYLRRLHLIYETKVFWLFRFLFYAPKTLRMPIFRLPRKTSRSRFAFQFRSLKGGRLFRRQASRRLQQSFVKGLTVLTLWKKRTENLKSLRVQWHLKRIGLSGTLTRRKTRSKLRHQYKLFLRKIPGPSAGKANNKKSKKILRLRKGHPRLLVLGIPFVRRQKKLRLRKFRQKATLSFFILKLNLLRLKATLEQVFFSRSKKQMRLLFHNIFGVPLLPGLASRSYMLSPLFLALYNVTGYSGLRYRSLRSFVPVGVVSVYFFTPQLILQWISYRFWKILKHTKRITQQQFLQFLTDMLEMLFATIGTLGGFRLEIHGKLGGSLRTKAWRLLTGCRLQRQTLHGNSFQFSSQAFPTFAGILFFKLWFLRHVVNGTDQALA